MAPQAQIIRCLGLVAVGLAEPLTEEYVRSNIHGLWESFKQEHGRTYGTPEDEQFRFGTFQASLLKAAEWQSLNPDAEFGATKFSDYTDDEFKQRLGLTPASNHTAEDIFSEDEVAAALASGGVDWRTKGVVVPVKDQGDCGGCWAFAAAANIESTWAIAGNSLTSLSEQQFLACDDWFPCMGCNGGEMSCAFQYLNSDNKGHVYTEKSYPYTAGAASKEGNCKSGTTGATVSGSKDLPSNEGQMAAWVSSTGPIAIGAHADPWKQYKSGILTSCGSKTAAVDHAIVIVGYGTESGKDYWLIRNSWGESFGESGYIRIGRGSNVCQVKSQPITAKVSGSAQVTV